LSNLAKKCALFGLLGVNSRKPTYMFMVAPFSAQKFISHTVIFSKTLARTWLFLRCL